MPSHKTEKRRGEWVRWGRGMCEGWSLEIGSAFRGTVVRSETPGMPTTWIASINTTAVGEYLALDIAMRQVEERMQSDMKLVLHDWEMYCSAKAKPAR